jgi:two-component system, chemotaxis family, sensor kinase CheA
VNRLLQEFITESHEILDRMESCLIALEADPSEWEPGVGELFRAIHTIKGTAGFMGFTRMERLTHAGEHLLCALRDKQVVLSDAVLSGLFEALNGVKTVLQLIEVTGGEGTRAGDEDSLLISNLAGLSGRVLDRKEEFPPISLRVSSDQPSSAGCERTVRVNVGALEHILQLARELTSVRDQVMQGDGPTREPAVWGRHLEIIATDLQQTVVQARMQSLKDLFGRFPRMVQDLACSCGREVGLQLEGQETNLDRSLIESIKEPLIHALRNAIDHGIEPPECRRREGKPDVGRILLRALSHPREVVIEISDDGGGVPLKRVRTRAVELGFVTAEQVLRMTDQETVQLIFLPGFSTAERVTTISGRGVGMDAIRSAMEKVGGRVELESCPGKGTLLRLRVPWLTQMPMEPIEKSSFMKEEVSEGGPLQIDRGEREGLSVDQDEQDSGCVFVALEPHRYFRP